VVEPADNQEARSAEAKAATPVREAASHLGRRSVPPAAVAAGAEEQAASRQVNRRPAAARVERVASHRASCPAVPAERVASHRAEYRHRAVPEEEIVNS